MFDQLFGGLSSLGNSLSSMGSDLSSKVSDFFSEDPEYDEETGQAKNKAAFEEQIATAEAEGDMEYAESLRKDLDKFEKSQMADIAEGPSKILEGGSNDVLRGTQISAPKPPSVRPRGGRIGVTYPYKSVAEGSYQQGVAYDDLVDKLVKGLLSEQIRQLPYRGLI